MSICYNPNFWKNFSNALVQTQNYLIFSLRRLNNKEGTYKEGLAQLIAFENSVETSINNYALNILEEKLEVPKLRSVTFAALEMTMYIQNILFQHLDNLSVMGNSKMTEMIRLDKQESAKVINELTWMDRRGMSVKPSMMKMSIHSYNNDLSPIEEEDSNDRFFLNFLMKYYA